MRQIKQKTPQIAGFSGIVLQILVVVKPSYFGYIFCQSDHLLGVAKLIVIPHIKHNAFLVWMNQSGEAVEY